ncbi:hypothetical protein OAU25_01090 [Crocinitomicaceae bacterium]|nr:hypothetical protein [Crocinitomicaceae bacterium]
MEVLHLQLNRKHMMKYMLTFLVVWCAIGHATSMQHRSTNATADSTRHLVLSKGKKHYNVKEGTKIKIKSNGTTHRGPLKIINDSTIAIHSTPILLSEIDAVITSAKANRVLLLMGVTAPLQYLGGLLMVEGISAKDYDFAAFGGILLGLVNVPIFMHSKRFKALKWIVRQNGIIQRKWNYSIHHAFN